MSANEPGQPVLHVSRHAVQTMLHEALAHQPAICGGLLAGRGRRIDVAVPVANNAPDPTRRCMLAAPAVLAALQAWQERGLSLIGLYRSYLAHIVPARMDFSAMLADASPLAGLPVTRLWHVAIALDTQGRLDMRAFAAAGDDQREIACELIEDGSTTPTVQ